MACHGNLDAGGFWMLVFQDVVLGGLPGWKAGRVLVRAGSVLGSEPWYKRGEVACGWGVCDSCSVNINYK